MLKIAKKLTILITVFLFFNKAFANDIPVIVISPGKTPQSLSTVGSTVTVIDGETIRNLMRVFLVRLSINNLVAPTLFKMVAMVLTWVSN